jgi:hypothetical protein
MTREDDIRKLCAAVLEMSPEFWDNPNGPYEHTCPFCRVMVGTGGNQSNPSMAELPHDANCAYLIAKDLMTGIK